MFHHGLLNVQQHPEHMPFMSSVMLMLGGKGALPHPKQPGFFPDIHEVGRSPRRVSPISVTITQLDSQLNMTWSIVWIFQELPKQEAYFCCLLWSCLFVDLTMMTSTMFYPGFFTIPFPFSVEIESTKMGH